MTTQVFDKIKLLNHGGELPGAVSLDSGQLVVDGDVIEFRGNKTTVRMTPIRDITYENVVISIHYGDSSAAHFQDWGRGIFRVQGQTRALSEELRSLLHPAGVTEVESQERAVRRNEQVVAQATEELGKARRQMWIGSAIFVVGGLVTIVSLAMATGGGQYVVAYGALLVGAGAFLTGLGAYRSAQKRIADPARSIELEPEKKKLIIAVTIGIGLLVIGLALAAAFLA